MPGNPHSSTPRAVGILFASGLLIAFAGLAGLGATAISVAAASAEGGSQQPAPVGRNPSRIHDKHGYADASGRVAILRRFASGDTAMREREGSFFPGRSGRSPGRPSDAAPLADYDEDSR